MKSAEQKLNEIQNIQVDEFSTPCSISCDKSSSVATLKEKMLSSNIRHIPIIEDSLPVGIVSDRDLKNIPADSKILAKDIMSTDVYSVECGTLLRDVIFHMSSKKIGSALVFDNIEKELYIFTSTDALNALNEVLRGGII